MNIIYDNTTIVDKLMDAINGSIKKKKKIEKIELTRQEWDEMDDHLRELRSIHKCYKGNYIFKFMGVDICPDQDARKSLAADRLHDIGTVFRMGIDPRLRS